MVIRKRVKLSSCHSGLHCHSGLDPESHSFVHNKGIPACAGMTPSCHPGLDPGSPSNFIIGGFLRSQE